LEIISKFRSNDSPDPMGAWTCIDSDLLALAWKEEVGGETWRGREFLVATLEGVSSALDLVQEDYKAWKQTSRKKKLSQ